MSAGNRALPREGGRDPYGVEPRSGPGAHLRRCRDCLGEGGGAQLGSPVSEAFG